MSGLQLAKGAATGAAGGAAGGPPGAIVGAGIGLLGSGIQAVGAGMSAAQAREDEEKRRKLEQENFDRTMRQQAQLTGRSQNMEGINFLAGQRAGAISQFGNRQLRDQALSMVKGV